MTNSSVPISKPRILVCGLTTADFVFAVPSLPDRAEKYIATSAQMIIGGGAANAAIAITRQQASAMLLARIGDDWIGNAVEKILKDENIDCCLLQKSKTAQTSYSSVLIDSAGERQIVNFRGTELDITPEWLTEDMYLSPGIDGYDFRRINAVLTDTRWLDGALAVLRLARKLGVPGVVDAEAPIPEPILQMASHIAFSKQGLFSYTDTDDIESALMTAHSKLNTWMCVTDGENGVYHIHDDKIWHTAAFSIEAKDTLAAGDTWHGVFTLGLCEGMDELNAIKYANAAAALKCINDGAGAMAAPTKQQTLQFLNNGVVDSF